VSSAVAHLILVRPMPTAAFYLMLAALLASCAGPRIAGVTITGAKFAVSEGDVRDAIAAGEHVSEQ
jgi:hypothetical protein